MQVVPQPGASGVRLPEQVTWVVAKGAVEGRSSWVLEWCLFDFMTCLLQKMLTVDATSSVSGGGSCQSTGSSAQWWKRLIGATTPRMAEHLVLRGRTGVRLGSCRVKAEKTLLEPKFHEVKTFPKEQQKGPIASCRSECRRSWMSLRTSRRSRREGSSSTSTCSRDLKTTLPRRWKMSARLQGWKWKWRVWTSASTRAMTSRTRRDGATWTRRSTMEASMEATLASRAGPLACSDGVHLRECRYRLDPQSSRTDCHLTRSPNRGRPTRGHCSLHGP